MKGKDLPSHLALSGPYHMLALVTTRVALEALVVCDHVNKGTRKKQS